MFFFLEMLLVLDLIFFVICFFEKKISIVIFLIILGDVGRVNEKFY